MKEILVQPELHRTVDFPSRIVIPGKQHAEDNRTSCKSRREILTIFVLPLTTYSLDLSQLHHFAKIIPSSNSNSPYAPGSGTPLVVLSSK